MLETLGLVLLAVWLFLIVIGVPPVLTVALPVVAAGCLIAAIALYPRGDW